MRKNWKKMLSVTLAAAGVIAAVSGCGGTETGQVAQQAAGQERTPEQEKTVEKEKTVIEYWHCNAENQGGLTVDELVKNFNENNDHIEVVAKYNPDMYKGLMQNLQAETATGNHPAVVQIGWAFLDYFSNNFAYIEPQAAIDQYDAEDKDFLKDHFLPNILELAVNSEGDQVGIPYSLSTPVLYINKDLLKEAGLDENGPQTWEQVKEFADTVKDKTGKYGFYMQEPADFWAQQGIIESNDSSMITKSGGKTEATFASEGGIEAMQLLADMISEGSALHVSWDEGCQSFIDGNCAMLYTTIARRASVQKGIQFDAATVKSPVWEGKERFLRAGVSSQLRRRMRSRLPLRGNLKSIFTAWNRWRPGQREPVMFLRERTLLRAKTD